MRTTLTHAVSAVALIYLAGGYGLAAPPTRFSVPPFSAPFEEVLDDAVDGARFPSR